MPKVFTLSEQPKGISRWGRIIVSEMKLNYPQVLSGNLSLSTALADAGMALCWRKVGANAINQ
ncbi:MAG: hypothetical protein ACI9V1_003089 [Spirosomataceae bacterium]|jgi:hypothetical protein